MTYAVCNRDNIGVLLTTQRGRYSLRTIIPNSHMRARWRWPVEEASPTIQRGFKMDPCFVSAVFKIGMVCTVAQKLAVDARQGCRNMRSGLNAT